MWLGAGLGMQGAQQARWAAAGVRALRGARRMQARARAESGRR